VPVYRRMTGALTIIVATGDPERLHAALTFAAASSAIGTATKLHLHEGAVPLLRAPMLAPMDEKRSAAGLPTLAQIYGEALGLGVNVTVCQSGLALAGLTIDSLEGTAEAQGPIGVLADADSRLLVF